MAGNFLNPLEFYPRFHHITDQIYEQLDTKSLKNCRKVSKLWQKCIDDKKYTWIQIVNIPKILQKEDTYLHLSAKRGQTKMFENILDKEDVKNPKNQDGDTAFHYVCQNGHLKIANIIILRSAELNFDLNAKNKHGITAFNFACRRGQSKIVEMLVDISAEFNIEMNVKDNCGFTAFHEACRNGHRQLADILIKQIQH